MTTAKEILDKHVGIEILKPYPNVEDAMIEFAKMHVERALQKAYKRGRIVNQDGEKCIAYGFSNGGGWKSGEIDKHSITNAYPVSNIK